jgi:hypothetical protein
MSETHRESDYFVEEHHRRHVEVEHEVLKRGKVKTLVILSFTEILNSWKLSSYIGKFGREEEESTIYSI